LGLCSHKAERSQELRRWLPQAPFHCTTVWPGTCSNFNDPSHPGGSQAPASPRTHLLLRRQVRSRETSNSFAYTPYRFPSSPAIFECGHDDARFLTRRLTGDWLSTEQKLPTSPIESNHVHLFCPNHFGSLSGPTIISQILSVNTPLGAQFASLPCRV